MADIDLTKFCSSLGDDEPRPVLSAPIHFGEWSIATNGHIGVRISRIEGTENTQEAPLTASVLSIFERFHRADDLGELPVFTPPEGQCRCEWCNGTARGEFGDEPCQECYGTGKMPLLNSVSVEIDGTVLSGRYFSLIQALPFPKISYASLIGSVDPLSPMSFVFDGGIGLLMPMRRPNETHFQLSRPGKSAVQS